MFDYDKVMRKFKKYPDMTDRKKKRFMKKLFFDEEFKEWLYNSSKSGNKPVTTEDVDNLFKELTKPKIMQAIIDLVEDEGYYEFDRTHATFIYSICNFAIELNNDRANSLKADADGGKLDSRDIKMLKSKIDKYSELISEVIIICKKIMKRDVKKLSETTNIDKMICYQGFWSVPDPKYVPSFKVGFYLNGLLTSIYSNAATNGYKSGNRYWKAYFSKIFGKNNVPNVATFILLEGVNRINKFKNHDGIEDVKDCWDDLTAFALKELNDSPDSVRNQMIELYIKRVEKMFKNNAYDLRVDILSIPTQFRNLISTISKYKDKLIDVLKK